MAVTSILLSIIAIIFLINKLKLHPFLALFLVSVALGLAFGMSPELVIASVQDGFGGTLGKIGLVIILGIMIGAFLEKTGAALVLANKILSIIGIKRVTTAMGVIGYIISIPVFADSGFLLLAPLNKSLTRKAGLSLAGTAVALGLGLSSTHALAPPTPGPVAAAGILNADMGLVMGIGLLAAALALVAALIFAHKVAAKTWIDPGPLVESEVSGPAHTPSLLRSSLPIIVPVVLIVLKSLATTFAGDSITPWLKELLSFIGEPVIALLIGFAFCLLLPQKLEKSMLSTDGWVGKALTDSATILLVTGAGGIFGMVLRNSNVATLLGETLSQTNIGIFLPFILAAAIKTAQGSSTVSLITTASIMAPMMETLGFTSEIDKALIVVAIGAGSLIVSHVNDSYFWVLTQLSKMDVKTGYRLHTTGTLIIGSTAMAGVFILYSLFH